ncbi:MAG: PTS sugar transporter subunit IIA [Coxiellaceae bacterium]|nr:MAG: PTS sugar transporter subunit IIA [Coxiellaceae bacterium]
MTVGIIIISHDEIGSALLNAVRVTFGKDLPLPVTTVDVSPDTNPDELIPKLKKFIAKIDHGDGVLILTDLFGATPSNIAQEIQNEDVRIVSGLNLPMLIRVLNYPQLNLQQLAEKALQGGQAGIIDIES